MCTSYVVPIGFDSEKYLSKEFKEEHKDDPKAEKKAYMSYY